jgi:hypothetical protein
MVACARRCCLCHKYCGVNMECAHIDQESEGGSNEADNCIPVCFDCHSGIGHYNPSHPRGTKFTPTELRKHRNRWYKQIEDNPSVLTPDYIEIDSHLFHKLYEILGGSSRMQHFKNHDYGATYARAHDNRIADFLHESENPEAEFLTFSMESSFADLKAAIKDYASSCAGRVWQNQDGTNGIPSEWTDKDEITRTRFFDAQKVMNDKAATVWDRYAKFVSEGRRILRVKLEEVVIKTL